MTKRVAIVQSNYIPWKGYFDLIAHVDEFVLYDDVQYTRRDWRNRNRIKTPEGTRWLTVPVRVKGRYDQSIRETEIDGADWAQVHWRTLHQCYGRAEHFRSVAEKLEPLFLEATYSHLSMLNRSLIEWACGYLGIRTRISSSSDYRLEAARTERLAGICEQTGASEYVSGPSARDYLDEAVFRRRGIAVAWFDYAGYAVYPQLWGEFEHGVTVLDLLFNCGERAPQYMRYVRQ